MWIITLVGVLAALIALVLFFLWVPLDFTLELDVHGRPKLSVRYSWFFGLVKGSPRDRGEKRPPRKKSAGRHRRRPDIRLAYRLLKVRGLVKNTLRLVKEVLISFRWQGLAADFRLSLDDPADTGMLFAVLGPATALLGPTVFERVNLQPRFEEGPLVEGNSHGTARLRPIRLLPSVLKFTFSRPTAHALWILLAARFRRKK